MLARQRHDLIIDQIRQHGTARVRDLATMMQVSDVTIRRDLDQLAAQQLIEKVHGGAALPEDASSFEPGFDAKRQRQAAEKDAIAQRALDFVAPSAAIGITAGTTTWTFARRLRALSDLTVVTNAPSIAQTLYQLPEHQMSVVTTGGVRTPSDALVGPLATRALGSMHVDVLFLGVHGMDPGTGFSTPNLAEAEVNQAFIASARQVIVLADHTKWGTRGLAQIASLDRADVVISDGALPREASATLRDRGVQVELVPN